MFDIGLGEIFVILVVALLVFGPERLPEMAKQAASFVRDLRAMVANARRDLSGSVGDLGLDPEDLKTLRELRNPKSFVRNHVLDKVDLGLDDFDADDDKPRRRPAAGKGNGKPASRVNGGRPANVAAESSASSPEPADPAASAVPEPARFDPEAT